MDSVHQTRKERLRRIAYAVFVAVATCVLLIVKFMLNPGTKTTTGHVAIYWGWKMNNLVFAFGVRGMVGIVMVPVSHPDYVEKILRANQVAGKFMIAVLISQSCLICLLLFLRTTAPVSLVTAKPLLSLRTMSF